MRKSGDVTLRLFQKDVKHIFSMILLLVLPWGVLQCFLWFCLPCLAESVHRCPAGRMMSMCPLKKPHLPGRWSDVLGIKQQFKGSLIRLYLSVKCI